MEEKTKFVRIITKDWPSDDQVLLVLIYKILIILKVEVTMMMFVRN